MDDRERQERYLLGDASVFAEVDRWVRSLLAKRYPALSGESEDISQVVHENLLKNLRAGKWEGRGSLRHYVSGIAHYVAIARLRERYRHRALHESLAREPTKRGSDNPYRTLEALDRGKLIRQLFLSLPTECRELWRLVYGEKLPYGEVAERLGIPAGTVKSRMWHCRRKAMAIMRRIRTIGRMGPRSPEAGP